MRNNCNVLAHIMFKQPIYGSCEPLVRLVGGFFPKHHLVWLSEKFGYTLLEILSIEEAYVIPAVLV